MNAIPCERCMTAVEAADARIEASAYETAQGMAYGDVEQVAYARATELARICADGRCQYLSPMELAALDLTRFPDMGGQ